MRCKFADAACEFAAGEDVRTVYGAKAGNPVYVEGEAQGPRIAAY